MKIFPKADCRNIVQQNAENELLLYNLLIHKVFCLNQTSRDIYNLCDGANDIAEIAVKTKLPETVVKLAINDLSKQDLLTEQVEIQTSRRDLLRNIALTSIALPIVTTLIAPNAARAASTCGTIPPNGTFSIPNNGGGTSSCFTSANDARCQSCRVNAAACSNTNCDTVTCTCR